MDDVAVEGSNLAKVGSDEDKKLRKAAAETEPCWKPAGKEEGIQIWRVEKFDMKVWPQNKYGSFHVGDSYIVLHTELVNKSKLEKHLYFWLGDESSIDEMGTAAYKAVELSDFFDGRCTQSRETQGAESANFQDLFPEGIVYLPGGVPSGFRQVINDCFEARLYQIRKTAKGVVEQEVTLNRVSLNQGDCFVLDSGRILYIWHGDGAHPMEKYEANAFASRLEAKRRGQATASHVMDGRFWELLGGKGKIRNAEDASDELQAPESGDGVLYKLTDESGKMEMFEVARGALRKEMLDSDNVMILDRIVELCVWIGADASLGETRSALWAAYNFLKINRRDLQIPIHMYKEGQAISHEAWNSVFEDRKAASRQLKGRRGSIA